MSMLRSRPILRLVQPPAPEPGPVSFCSHCAARGAAPAPGGRVCDRCGFGLMLETQEDLAPEPGSAFLVLDGSMSVCAVSRGAERLLAVTELAAVNHHVSELLTLAPVESQGGRSLAVAVTQAVRGDRPAERFVLRPANVFGVRLVARIGSCGPRPGALIVFDGA